jgi:hypothetical protein
VVVVAAGTTLEAAVLVVFVPVLYLLRLVLL